MGPNDLYIQANNKDIEQFRREKRFREGCYDKSPWKGVTAEYPSTRSSATEKGGYVVHLQLLHDVIRTRDIFLLSELSVTI